MPKKKTIIQIAGNPVYAMKPSQSTAIINPATGLSQFGTFPEIDLGQEIFDSGPIFLRYGVHRGPHNGWGFEHIWQERFRSAATQNAATPLVTSLINSVLVPGAGIYHEYVNIGTAGNRCSVFRNAAGVVIVERRLDGRNNVFYSITTAIPRAQPHGVEVGRL